MSQVRMSIYRYFNFYLTVEDIETPTVAWLITCSPWGFSTFRRLL